MGCADGRKISAAPELKETYKKGQAGHVGSGWQAVFFCSRNRIAHTAITTRARRDPTYL
jgi:hypothetical protein